MHTQLVGDKMSTYNSDLSGNVKISLDLSSSGECIYISGEELKKFIFSTCGLDEETLENLYRFSSEMLGRE